MTNRQTLEVLANEKNKACVTISLNTHRTHPDNAQDEIVLKNLLKEAENRIISEFEKREMSSLLEKLSSVAIDPNYNLDSLHLFLSNDTKEIIKSPWPTQSDSVQIGDSFALRSLIKMINKSKEYYILLLSQGSVNLYNIINDGIVAEIKNDDFPFAENTHYTTDKEKQSDGKLMDNMVREYFNKVDKALVKLHNETGLACIVICTEDNHSRLMQVADKATIYEGYVPIDYNNVAPHQIAKQAWEVAKLVQQQERTEAIAEMNEAVGQGNVLTDLQEIYQAAIDGKGDLLIVHENFVQPVQMNGDRNFDLVTDSTEAGVIDDITSDIAWEVLSKKGRVVFTKQDELKELGKIVLKTRY